MNEILFKNADNKIIHIVNALQKQIKGTNFEGKVYLVGGFVRNLILNQPIKDVDIVVEKENGGLMLANYLAVKNKCWVIDKNPVIFERFGTAKLNIYNDEIFKEYDLEFVQSQKEPNSFCTIEEDSKCRDFTINSLYYNISTEKLVDYNCGIQDIVDQKIKTPTDPFVTFNADPLRMLRAIRFSALYGWGIEKNTWFGIVENAKKIRTVSKERIASELSKILTSPNASVGIRKLYYSGLLHRILQDIYDTTKCFEDAAKGITTFEHTLQVLDETQPIIEHRLAALFHDVGRIVTQHDRTVNPDKFSAEVAVADLKDLKYSNDIIKAVETAIINHRCFKSLADGVIPTDKKIRKFVSSCKDNLAITLDLMNANNVHQANSPKKRQVFDIITRMEELEKEENLKNTKLPVDGSDLMKYLKIKQGPWIGTVLAEIKEAYFENPNITKDECFEIAEKVLSKIY